MWRAGAAAAELPPGPRVAADGMLKSPSEDVILPCYRATFDKPLIPCFDFLSLSAGAFIV